MRARPRVIAVSLLLMVWQTPSSCASSRSERDASATVGPRDLARFVHAFVGTRRSGNTFPGAAAPFGMVQVSPDTGGEAGYDYDQSTIYGFSQTHLSGVGCRALGDLPIMPTTGAVSIDPGAYASRYSHANEEASPGYYRVRLDRYDVDVELTATARTGWQRFTFPRGRGAANVLFNTGKANQRVLGSDVQIRGDRTVEGRIRAGGFCAGSRDEHTVYFSARFDRPFESFGTWRADAVARGSRASSSTTEGGAWVTFDTRTSQRVVLQVGLSYTGIEGARRNLAAETGGRFDFDARRRAVRARWNELLHRIEIDRATDAERVVFYTALYHALLHPNLFGDVDGRYVGFDRRVHAARDFTPYATFSLWDTYRPQNQLLALLLPDVARDIYLSILASEREGGWLPRWSLLNAETNVMTGDPVTPFLVEGWSKGLLAGHEQEAYRALRRNATDEPLAASPYNGRAGVEHYVRRGYIPSGLTPGVDCAQKFADNDCARPASATLEYAAADAALALMARALGHDDDARLFAERGGFYRNLWDRETRIFRPRTRDGVWLSPFEPARAGRLFHEGGAYQYEWMVPQDLAGLVALLGGPREAEQRLDEFFAYRALVRDPAGTARREWIHSPYDYYGRTTYNPNNEPDLFAPYVYLWVGAPAKTTQVVRAAMTLFTGEPDGMTGNDDLGTMSAWYVLSALGMYPTMSGASYFALATPAFDRATVHVGAFRAVQGGALVISARGGGRGRAGARATEAIREASINGRPTTRSWIDWRAIRHGGAIAYRIDDEPGRWGARPEDAPPSVHRATPSARVEIAASASDALVPTSRATRTAAVHAFVLAQAPRSVRATLAIAVPSGWTASPSRVELDLRSEGLPAQRDVAVTIAIPAGARDGTYPWTATVTVAGRAAVVARAEVTLLTPRCALRSRAECALDLSRYYNKDGTAAIGGAASDADFDGSRRCLDAALVPPSGALRVGGSMYVAPDPNGSARNIVEARGQSILFPEGRYASVRILGAAHHEEIARVLTVMYADGSTATAALRLADWMHAPVPPSTIAIAMPHWIRDGAPTEQPVSIFALELALDPTKSARAIVLPDEPHLEVYALTLAM